MTTQLLRRRAPKLVLAGAIAALGAAAVLAAPGSAHPVQTLQLHDTADPSVGFGLHGRPHEGSRFGFGANTTGDDTGTVRLVCTVLGGTPSVCTIQLDLAHGTLTAQGSVPQTAHDTPFAITGGTGAYDGARGTALVTDTSPTTSDVTITLLR